MTQVSSSQILIYQTESGQIKIDVLLENETVWLTQKLMSELFQVAKPTISEHIKHISQEGELEKEATVRKFRTVQTEGTRNVNREIAYYNLDMIISVGYRVQPHVAIRFRQWATQDIRTAEKRFYQKITEIYATSTDFDPTLETSITFFKTVQSKLHWAITG